MVVAVARVIVRGSAAVAAAPRSTLDVGLQREGEITSFAACLGNKYLVSGPRRRSCRTNYTKKWTEHRNFLLNSFSLLLISKLFKANTTLFKLITPLSLVRKDRAQYSPLVRPGGCAFL